VAFAIKKDGWLYRWFGGIGWRDYLLALPFCIGLLVMPVLPTAGVAYVQAQGQAPLVGLALLLLTFGYPVLRVKHPRAAWWVATIIAISSIGGAIGLSVIVGFFLGPFVIGAWILMIPFGAVNWKKLEPRSFAVVAAIVLGHLLWMGSWGQAVTATIVMGLMGLYFLLPDRDNFARAPLIVAAATTIILAHGHYFYFDVGGRAQVEKHAAARKVFEYSGQRHGWALALGANPRFLTPSCNGQKFFVGTKFTLRSGLTELDPATGQRRFAPMSGGTTDNMALDCKSHSLFIGNMGANTIYAVDETNPSRVLLKEKLEGARVGLVRLDRKVNRLYVAASNKRFLYVLRASNLAEMGRVEFAQSPTDIVIDRQGGHDVIVATMGGEVARISAKAGGKAASANPNFGQFFYNLALDEKNRRLFVSSMFGRRIKVLDADTLAQIGESVVLRGARYMAFDSRRELLYVANFYRGTIRAYAFESGRLREVWTMDVGKRVRYLTLDHRRDQLCFASQVGGYCLALEVLRPAPPPEEKAASPTPAAESEEGSEDEGGEGDATAE
jgi:sugar lactone lactonase YvrE